MNRPLSTYIPLKTRWAIASRLNRLPSFCWARLVFWVLNDDRGENQLREARGWDCTREDGGLRCGMCYCGKRRTAEADAVMRAGGGGPGVLVDAEGRRVR
jgi:hypothetical protein